MIGHCEGTSGGGLQLQGSLRLEHTVFRGNRANAGGAIEAARWATVVAEGADFVDTQAWLGGGAVSFRGAPTSDG